MEATHRRGNTASGPKSHTPIDTEMSNVPSPKGSNRFYSTQDSGDISRRLNIVLCNRCAITENSVATKASHRESQSTTHRKGAGAHPGAQNRFSSLCPQPLDMVAGFTHQCAFIE